MGGWRFQTDVPHIETRRMSQSLSQIYIHVIFSTKQRKPFLQSKQLREDLHAYLAGIFQNQGSPSIIIGGVEDHVHALCRLSKTGSVADLIRDVKRDSSVWIKEQARQLAMFEWQAGYGAFSISPSHIEPLKVYIANQEEHHKRESFQDELRRLLKKYRVEFDERYLWD
jgi:REP element-mobilizing transposase RayT